MKIMSILPIALGLMILIAGLIGVNYLSYDDQRKAAEHYCAMVELNRASEGKLGWPDYEGTYEEGCLD